MGIVRNVRLLRRIAPRSRTSSLRSWAICQHTGESTQVAQLACGTRAVASQGVPLYVQAALHKELSSLSKAGDTSGIIDTFRRHYESFPHTHNSIADLDSCMAALGNCRGDAPIDAGQALWLLQHVQDTLRTQDYTSGNSANIRSFVSISWALAKLVRRRRQLPHEVLSKVPETFAVIETAVRPALGDGTDPKNLSLVGWSFAKAGTGSQAFFLEIGDAALSKLHQFTPRELSNLCWVFATIRAKHPVLAKTSEKLTDVNEQVELEGEHDISSITWAFAVLKMRDSKLFQCAGAAAEKYMHQFTMQGVATVTWAFASVREQAVFAPAAMSRVESGGAWKQLEPRGCAMLLWSLAALRHNSDRAELFFRFVGDRCIVPRIEHFRAQDVSNCVWAFATARFTHQAGISALTKRASETIENFNHQSLANAVWGCAKLRLPAPSLFEAAVAETLRRPIRSWPAQALATLFWSCAEVGRRPLELLEPLNMELQARPRAFNDLDLATLVTSLSAGGNARTEGEWEGEAKANRRLLLSRIAGEAKLRDLPLTQDALAFRGGDKQTDGRSALPELSSNDSS